MTKRERTLLLNSHVIRELGWFRQLLEQHERLTRDLVAAALSRDKRRILDIMLQRLKTQAASEWKGDPRKVQELGPDHATWPRCQLCGHKIRYLFEIHNPLTGKFLQVGKECVKHFGIDFGGKSISELLRQAERASRLTRLEERLPGVSRAVEGWNAALEQYPVIVPLQYEERHRELGRRAEVVYNQYLEGSAGDLEAVVAELSAILAERERLHREIAECVRGLSKDEFAARKEIAVWLRNFGGEKAELALKWIKEDGGRITWRTAHRIAEPSFMRVVAAKLAASLARTGIAGLEPEPESRGYVLRVARPARVLLFSRHDDLVLRYGGLIFGEPVSYPVDLPHLVQISRLHYTEANLRDVFAQLSKILEPFGIRAWGYAYEFNEAVFYDLETGDYLSLALKETLGRALEPLLGVGGIQAREFADQMKKVARRMTREGLKERQQIRRQGYTLVARELKERV